MFKKNKYFKVFLKQERTEPKKSIVSLNNLSINSIKEYLNEFGEIKEQKIIQESEKIVFFKKKLLKKGVKNKLKRSKSSTK